MLIEILMIIIGIFLPLALGVFLIKWIRHKEESMVLKSIQFYDQGFLCDFVNNHNIKIENIFCNFDSKDYVLFYWENKEL